MLTPSHSRAPWARRFLAVALVGWYVLASVRALVPELCLTMRTAEAEVGQNCAPVVEAGAQGCCAKPQPQAPAGGAAQAPGAPSESSCPFCHLAKALVEPLERVALAAPVEGEFPWVPREDSDPLLDAVAQCHPGRAPPTEA